MSANLTSATSQRSSRPSVAASWWIVNYSQPQLFFGDHRRHLRAAALEFHLGAFPIVNIGSMLSIFGSSVAASYAARRAAARTKPAPMRGLPRPAIA
jgi:hypothetical protein